MSNVINHRRTSAAHGTAASLRQRMLHAFKTKFSLYREIFKKNRKVRQHMKKVHNFEQSITKALKKGDFTTIHELLKNGSEEIKTTLNGMVDIFSAENELFRRQVDDIMKLLFLVERKDRALNDQDFESINTLLKAIISISKEIEQISSTMKEEAIDNSKKANLGILKLEQLKKDKENEFENVEKELRKVA